MDELGRLFRETHERQYGYATDEPFLIESLRIEMIARQAPNPAAIATSTGTTVPAPLKVSDCVFGPEGAIATPRHDRKTLPVGVAVAGPCIVEDAWSTVVIPPGSSVTADAHGHLHIEA
jgi:N-methylhydantoinase A